ncbi:MULTISPECIES: hypothetical protein [unclassified Paenibacillus]|uniref:hypothetical protein n=1 Tax=unclassified Paenibacillus TaxID=185978 RepID=UPI0009A7255A|nr:MULTISPECIES: hypothetical protein [unclassified Paenibacillus]SLK09740.1 hypothetical protein SAMN06272722_106175 [Paenibacillus sp. RU5A]SOC71711.1 hypothetical protein SAMN05880581_106175 [Paenibacillus sp. RU26A]SOC74067.1 hypothetical protein SAMN05880586_106175 [Paenibacillus sp. RU5M]
MNLFHIQSTLQEIDWTTSFLENNFIGIGWPATGDLEHEPTEEWKAQLVQRYRIGKAELRDVLDTLHTFVYIMQDGDYVLINDDEWTYVGDLGDYFYDDSNGTGEEYICHRRGVTWLGRIPLAELSDKVLSLVSHYSIIAKFEHPISQAQLEPWVSITSETNEGNNDSSVRVDEGTIQEALNVLKKALHSEEEDLRIRAAAAILQYAKS